MTWCSCGDRVAERAAALIAEFGRTNGTLVPQVWTSVQYVQLRSVSFAFAELDQHEHSGAHDEQADQVEPQRDHHLPGR